MVNFFEPVNLVSREAQTRVTDVVAHLKLRPQMSASVAALRLGGEIIADSLDTVRTVMSCDSVFEIFLRAKSAVCCDLAYASTFLWIARLLSAVWMVPAAIGAIAGYKRFQRVLWGPYASVQALEVGAYL